jgi:acyl carrier protein
LNRAEFITELSAILGAKVVDLKEDTRLDGFPGWDSMGKMAVITLIDTDVGLTVPYDTLERCETFGLLMAFVQPRLSDGALPEVAPPKQEAPHLQD